MLSPGMEKASKLAAQDEDRPPAVDPGQTGLQPAPHRVFMDPEQLRDLLHGVAPVDLYAPRIRPLHSANVRELSKTQNREIDRPHALTELGFDAGAEQSVLALVAGFSLAVDRNIAGRSDRTDLGELARQAAAESLSSFVGSGSRSLFGNSANDVQRELGRLATRGRFAHLARDFYARVIHKILEYYISRELPNHIGPDKSLQTIDRQIEFRGALERYCREVALVVEAFAGGWYSKTNYQGTLNPATAQSFSDYALKKLGDELRKRRASDA